MDNKNRDTNRRIINVGDTVDFNGKTYTIKAFVDQINGVKGRLGAAMIEFEEPLSIRDEFDLADCYSVVLIKENQS